MGVMSEENPKPFPFAPLWRRWCCNAVYEASNWYCATTYRNFCNRVCQADFSINCWDESEIQRCMNEWDVWWGTLALVLRKTRTHPPAPFSAAAAPDDEHALGSWAFCACSFFRTLLWFLLLTWCSVLLLPTKLVVRKHYSYDELSSSSPSFPGAAYGNAYTGHCSAHQARSWRQLPEQPAKDAAAVALNFLRPGLKILRQKYNKCRKHQKTNIHPRVKNPMQLMNVQHRRRG